MNISSAPSTRHAEYSLDELGLRLAFFDSQYAISELGSELAGWIGRQLDDSTAESGAFNCLADLRGVEADENGLAGSLAGLFERLEHHPASDRLLRVAMVCDPGIYDSLSRVLDRRASAAGRCDAFIRLENACRWLGPDLARAMERLDPGYGEYRYTHQVFPESGLIVRYVSGRVSRENLKQTTGKLLAAAPFPPGFRVLTDYRDANFTNVGNSLDAAVMSMLGQLAQSGLGRCAYLFSETDRARADHYRERLHEAGLDVRIMDSLEQACGWLEQDVVSVRSTLGALRVQGLFAPGRALPAMDKMPEVRAVEPAIALAGSPARFHDHFIWLPEQELMIRRVSGHCTAEDFVACTLWLDERTPVVSRPRIVFDMRDWELGQPDRLFLSHGATGAINEAVRGMVANLCSEELLHVAEGFAANKRSWNPNIRAVTTVYSAAAWVEQDQRVVARCLELLAEAQR